MSNIFTTNWGDLPPPKNIKVADIISNLRTKYMAWMENSEWPIYMTFIDHMSETTPRIITGKPDFASSILNLGSPTNCCNMAQGPTEAHIETN